MTRLYLTEQGAALTPHVVACWHAVERTFTAGLAAQGVSSCAGC